VSEHATVHVHVPVRFENEDASPGLKKGGVLNVVAHDIELVVDAANIPDEVVVDLTGLEVGDSIHISAVTLPKGTTALHADTDFSIATVVAPSALKSAEGEAEDEAAAEGE